jgi:uncharacterized protein (TIGR02246 family)
MNDDEEAIRRVVAGFEDAWNRHDVAAYAMLFAEDADQTTVRGIWSQGGAAIEAHMAPLFASQFKDSHFTVTGVRSRSLKPDVAAVDVHWRIAGDTDPDGTRRNPRQGLANLTMTEESGTWLIKIFHNMNLPVGG